MFAQQTGQILLQWLSHFPPATWNSCRPLSPQERWGGATSSDVEFCNFIRCKSFIRRLWSVELCCILSQAPSKVDRLLAGLVCYTRTSPALIPAGLTEHGGGVWSSQPLCKEKFPVSGPKYSAMPHHIYFSCRSPPPPEKEKKGFYPHCPPWGLKPRAQCTFPPPAWIVTEIQFV